MRVLSTALTLRNNMVRKKQTISREKYTIAQLERMTYLELLDAKLDADEKQLVREIMQRRAVENAESNWRAQLEEQPILDDLRAVGWDVDTVWRLVNTAEPYHEALPVLLKHLQLPYSDVTREGIARALTVRAARYAFDIFVEEYLKAPSGKGMRSPGDTTALELRAKHGLACAIAETVTQETLDTLLALIYDRRNGETRAYFLSSLKKSKDPRAKEALEKLASDPDLATEIASWTKRKRSQRPSKK